MHEIGLIPTDTGKIGGKETGQHMSHVIAADAGLLVLLRGSFGNIPQPSTTTGAVSRIPSERRKRPVRPNTRSRCATSMLGQNRRYLWFVTTVKNRWPPR